MNNIVWNSGLNPYNVYGHCDGGVPDEEGYLSGYDTPTLILPEVLPWPKQKRIEYEEVKIILLCTEFKFKAHT